MMTKRMAEASQSPVFSEAFRHAIREFAKLKREDANFEARYLALLFTEHVEV